MPHIKNGKLRHFYRFDATPEEHELLQRIKAKQGGTTQTVFRRLLEFVDRAEANPEMETMLAIDYVQGAAFDRWDHIPHYLLPSEEDRGRLLIAIQGVIATRQLVTRQLRTSQRVEEGQPTR